MNSPRGPSLRREGHLPHSKSAKSWQAKLADDKDLPKVVKLTGKMRERYGGGTMAIASPREVDALMKQVPRCKVTTINDLRACIAKRHGANIACPMTTGIFAWIAAHAAEEAASEGKKRITPYWRTLKNGGELNAKYPGGIKSVRKHLKAEGHVILQKGKRFVAEGFERNLFSRLNY